MRGSEIMSINEFMNRNFKEESKIAKIERKRKFIKITLVTGTIIFMVVANSLTGAEIAQAAGDTAGIDAGARRIYDKLLTVGKWIIIIKGGMSTVNHMVQEDFGTAKKSFLSYLLIYAILHGLPWGMDQVDEVFSDL